MSCSTSSWRSAERRPAWAALLACALLLPACAAQQHPHAGAGASAATANDFSLRDTQGRTVRLSDYLARRDVVLLNFWATWCSPCAGELPQLQRLYSTYKADGLVVLGIAMDGPESVAGVAPMARQLGVEFPVLLDEETRVVGIYNPKRTAPYSVLIGRDGRIDQRRDGYAPGDELDIERELRALLYPAPR